MMSKPKDIDYRQILKSLSAEEKRSLTALTNHHAAFYLAGHLGFIGLGLWFNITQSGLFGVLGMAIQGIGMCFLFCAMHEASHGTAFKTKAFNTALTHFVGLLILQGPLWFKSFMRLIIAIPMTKPLTLNALTQTAHMGAISLSSFWSHDLGLWPQNLGRQCVEPCRKTAIFPHLHVMRYSVKHG